MVQRYGWYIVAGVKKIGDMQNLVEEWLDLNKKMKKSMSHASRYPDV